jgi:glycine/D-amino acid oxidase-like deaminating enzyme
MDSGVDGKKVVIIGGGFYGLSIALFLHDELGMSNILVIDKASTMMSRASYVNQARVHNGYHYPRSVLTGSRSAVNFPRFVEDYKEAIVDNFDKYYGISKILSKVNARQFKSFTEKIGIEAKDPEQAIDDLFNKQLVEKVYETKEYAFDSRILRDLLLRKIKARPGIIIHGSEEVDYIESRDDRIAVNTNMDQYVVDKVINCAYSQINTLHRKSGIPLVALKHELTEMCLVRLPDNLKKFSITMMDGPFFSIMPFPSRGLHTLSHVRYTPHSSWLDDKNTPVEKHEVYRYFDSITLNSNYKKMYADVIRYIPALKSMEYAESITEVKTVLQKSEGDDSRPILFKPHFGIHNYTCIMGGKLDNIYDVFDELRGLYGEK